jgi:hypothetical protein
MLDIPRLTQKLAAAKSQFNDMPIADFNAARNKIALDEATAINEEIQLADVTIRTGIPLQSTGNANLHYGTTISTGTGFIS